MEHLRRQLDQLTVEANPALRAASRGPRHSRCPADHRWRQSAATAKPCGICRSLRRFTDRSFFGQAHQSSAQQRRRQASQQRLMAYCDGPTELFHPATKKYAAKRRVEGKTDRHILRSLKRYIAREIHRLLTDPHPVQTHTDLRPMRKAIGITITAAAEDLPFTLQQLSRMERGLTADASQAQQYREWLQHHSAAA